MTRGYSHIVIGAGAVGSAAAYWLSQRGAERVLVIEQFSLLPTMGSSGDHSRIIGHAHPSTDYTQLTGPMFEAWRQIEEQSGLRLYTRTGSLDLARHGGPGDQDILACRSAMDEVGIQYSDLNSDSLRSRFPQWRLPEDIVGLWQEEGGLLDIKKSVSAHTSLALAAGVEFWPHTKVTDLKLRADGVSVQSSAGAVDGENLVVAAGSWLGELMPALGLDVGLLTAREHSSYFSSARLPDFRPERHPVWTYHDDEEVYVGFPVYGEAATKLSLHVPKRPVAKDTAAFEDRDLDGKLLRAFLVEHLPWAVGLPLADKTRIYATPADHDFVLDTIPGHSHVAVFNGAGHAGAFASLVGQILADLTTAGTTPHAIDPFSLGRPSLAKPRHTSRTESRGPSGGKQTRRQSAPHAAAL